MSAAQGGRLARWLLIVACMTWPGARAMAQATQANAPVPEHTVEGKPATVLGQDVQGTDGKNLGRIIDILVDQDGHPLAAVVDFGGFMGLGNRKIAVDWHNLKFASGSAAHAVTVDLTPDQLKAAPEYKGSATHVTVVGAPPPAEHQARPVDASPAAPAAPPDTKPD